MNILFVENIIKHVHSWAREGCWNQVLFTFFSLFVLFSDMRSDVRKSMSSRFKILMDKSVQGTIYHFDYF